MKIVNPSAGPSPFAKAVEEISVVERRQTKCRELNMAHTSPRLEMEMTQKLLLGGIMPLLRFTPPQKPHESYRKTAFNLAISPFYVTFKRLERYRTCLFHTTSVF